MTFYRATFHASHCYAVEAIEARTPKQALRKARALYDRGMTDLDWWSYNGDHKSLEAISITAPDEVPACGWQSDELILQQAAGELFDALQLAVQALNTAPRFRVPYLSTDSYRIASICDRALARAKGGAK